MEKNKTVEEFFNDLPTEDKKEQDIFGDKPIEVQKEETKVEVSIPAKDDEPHKNRRHRRLEEQLEREREARIAAEARAQALSETRKFSQDTKDEVDPRWLTIYGDTPQTREAWKIQQDIFKEERVKAKNEAIEEMEERQRTEAKEAREAEQVIDSELEALEDQYDIDLTSNSPAARKARTEYLELVERISPKDQNGEIKEFGDFGAAWELYSQKKETTDNTRQREIASRSMKSSTGTPNIEQANDDATLAYLRSIGINV